jgi:hypothetical protein
MAKNRIILVCSNLQHQETAFCKEKLFIEDYKPQRVPEKWETWQRVPPHPDPLLK